MSEAHAAEQLAELHGPDHNPFYGTYVRDWIALCDDLRDADVRGYLILRSLVFEGKGVKNRVRVLTLAELCQLIPGPNGKPSSLSRIRELLRCLSAVGLITTPEGGPVTTSSGGRPRAAHCESRSMTSPRTPSSRGGPTRRRSSLPSGQRPSRRPSKRRSGTPPVRPPRLLVGIPTSRTLVGIPTSLVGILTRLVGIPTRTLVMTWENGRRSPALVLLLLLLLHNRWGRPEATVRGFYACGCACRLRRLKVRPLRAAPPPTPRSQQQRRRGGGRRRGGEAEQAGSEGPASGLGAEAGGR